MAVGQWARRARSAQERKRKAEYERLRRIKLRDEYYRLRNFDLFLEEQRERIKVRLREADTERRNRSYANYKDAITVVDRSPRLHCGGDQEEVSEVTLLGLPKADYTMEVKK